MQGVIGPIPKPGTPWEVGQMIAQLMRKILSLFRKPPQKEEAPAPSTETLKEQIEKYREAVRVNPDDGVSQYNLGTAYVLLKCYKDAIKPLKEVLRVNPEHESAHYQLGKALLECGRDDDAIDALKFAHDKNRESHAITKLLAEAHKNLTVYYGRVKQYEESMAHFKQATDLIPDYGPAHYALGINFEQCGRYQEALQKFKEALRMDKNLLVDVYYYYGKIYAKLGKEKKALKYYKEAIDVNPKAALCQLQLGLLYSKLKKYDKTVEHLQTALRFSPNLATDAHFQMGVALVKLGRYQEALRPLKKALKLSPDHEVVRDSLVMTYMKLAEMFRKSGGLKEEVAALKEAEELDPGRVSLHAGLSQAFENMNKGVDAVIHCIIAKQLHIEQRNEKEMESTMRRLASLYKKYKFNAENFKNVKPPRRKH